MKLTGILTQIRENVGQVRQKSFQINISVNPAALTPYGVNLLYLLLNQYQDIYFITINNLPYCVMPDAGDHIVYEKNCQDNTFYDNICQTCTFRKTCPGWPESTHINRQNIQPIKDIPREIVIEITTKCNLNCSACTIDKTCSIEIPFTRIENILKECKDIGIRAVRFTGGEPLLHKEIKKMLLLAKKNKFYVLVNTNAVSLNRETLTILKKTTDNILISLQGYNEQTERKYTNSSLDWTAKLTNILLLKSRIPVVRIGTVITRTLIENMGNYVKLLKKLRLSNWELYRPITTKIDDNFKISRQDILGVMEYILSLKKQGMKVRIANPVPFCITENISLSTDSLLGAAADDGHSRLVWDTRGYYKPSYFINKNLGTGITEAWQHPFLKKIKDISYLPAACKKCVYLKWCKGGSRAIAKLAAKSFCSPDPLMPAQK